MDGEEEENDLMLTPPATVRKCKHKSKDWDDSYFLVMFRHR
jgi:hypothetical protein